MEKFSQPEKDGEGPDEIDVSLEKDIGHARYNHTLARNVENKVSQDIKAYTAHVTTLAEKTGRTVAEIVAEEKAEIKRLGSIEAFLRNLETKE